MKIKFKKCKSNFTAKVEGADPDMRLGEAVGLVQVGVLVHPLYHPGRGHGGGDPAEAAGAMELELEKGDRVQSSHTWGGPCLFISTGAKSSPIPHQPKAA